MARHYKYNNNICTIICLYVDDLLIFGSNIHVVNAVKSLLSNNFDMKDLGEANVILGIKITRSEKGISLDQSHYVEKIFRKYNYFDCKPACTPYDPSVKLFENTGESVKQSEYASIIGSLRYATDCTRPDIAYVVCNALFTYLIILVEFRVFYMIYVDKCHVVVY